MNHPVVSDLENRGYLSAFQIHTQILTASVILVFNECSECGGSVMVCVKMSVWGKICTAILLLLLLLFKLNANPTSNLLIRGKPTWGIGE